MKLLKKLTLLLSLYSLLLCGCNQEANWSKDKLTKKWFVNKVVQIESGEELPVIECYYIDFTSDNSYSSFGIIQSEGKWKLKGDYIEFEENKLKIIDLSNDSLSCELEGNYYYFSLECEIESMNN